MEEKVWVVWECEGHPICYSKYRRRALKKAMEYEEGFIDHVFSLDKPRTAEKEARE